MQQKKSLLTGPVEPIINIAKHVGDYILMPNWGNVPAEKKADGSDITPVDRIANSFLIERLTEMTPDIPIVSEEAGYDSNVTAAQNRVHWMIDPLDGTSTYIEGPKLGDDAGFGVHIALIENGVPVKGIAYFPVTDRTFFTGNDGHAYLQTKGEAKERLHVRKYSEDPLLQASVPWLMKKRPAFINGQKYTAVPAVGGEMVCNVASGQADLMWLERPDSSENIHTRHVLNMWDVAAGHAILRAAGGDMFEMGSKKQVRYQNPDFRVNACVAGHPDLLHRIGFTPDGHRQDHMEFNLI